MDPKLNDLLHWAVENTNTPATQSQTRSSTAIGPVVSSDPTPLTITYNPHQPSQASVPSTHKKLDTGVLDAILGRTDAVRMREAISIFEDPKKSIHERCNAGEELEDLIQDLDNANDMEVLGIWPKLMTLMESNTSGGNSKDDDLIKFHACWICGTAVQNNPKSQTAFLKKEPLPAILEILSQGSEATQAKAMYCLSSTLKHAPSETGVIQKFSEAHGWEVLHDCLRGPSMILRRKTVFLINTLLLEESLDLHELRSSGLLNTLITSLSPSRSIPAGKDGDISAQDEDYVEKVLRTITTILINASTRPNQILLEDEKNVVKEVLKEMKLDSTSLKQLIESSGIGESEWSEAIATLAPFSLE
ncbi:hypothetical protein MJO29_014679 [Puccinia striiformis f. sp. tritici]|uniref:Nucleotide exchange factor Fes1 domain-containing protein n=1 Tax=Puccinia striiformis f. sp. tritici PST-78 TaxID=1165861 RepID=A0A0L0VE67_9BASI|nr:hypothetical protein MJO29_014679 [Puccinia striiformis f. sp. tritici]KAI9608119.1 hypothetical protein H4Q26_005575 [Puccinia striiformis f. sp. tritici PST-130]KAI9624262.1 hypothetical protein H4Q26_016970 [Puccinia striiformis f. sp. tritici PST-130]KNE97607.1 hypothetical protein PSTG_09156 [Puccinia striiformis f. sp. tritici PST-78]